MSEIVVIARIKFAPDQRGIVTAATLALASASRSEDGCLAYEVFLNSEHDDGDLLIHEIWQDADALRAHGSSDHVQEFRRAIRDRAEVAVRKLADL
ncbi:MAG: putative quinol monooxygenase [Pseudomonadota bacterium]|nr:putative quinol monooxygenase [Pseudomonadota bacterium]